jgi:hypothetical protein
MLTYSTEAWTVCKRDESRITSVDMEFMRGTIDYTGLDYEKNLYAMRELNTQPVMEFIDN